MIMLRRTHKRILENYINALDMQEEEIAQLRDLTDNLIDFANSLLETGNFNKKVKPSLDSRFKILVAEAEDEQSD